jgi:hypothetical protein
MEPRATSSTGPGARRRGLACTLVLAVVLLVPLGSATAAAAPRPFEVHGSCATSKPFPPAARCSFDRPEHARGTIVFHSNVGKRRLKVCQRIHGLSFKGHQCVKGQQPTAYEAIPFELNGAYKKFRVVVDVYASRASGGGYERAARVSLRFSP